MEGKTQYSWRTTGIGRVLLRNTLTDSNISNSQTSHVIILNQTLAIKTSEFRNGISAGLSDQHITGVLWPRY